MNISQHCPLLAGQQTRLSRYIGTGYIDEALLILDSRCRLNTGHGEHELDATAMLKPHVIKCVCLKGIVCPYF